MATSAVARPSPVQSPLPITIPASIIWHLVLIAACVYLASYIFSPAVGDFGRLGRPVQVFVGLFVLLPAVGAIFSSVQLLRRKPSGRYSALVIQYLGFVLSIVVVLHLWGFFTSFEAGVDTLMRNSGLLFGFPIAYGVFWLSGRMEEGTRLRSLLEQAALILGMITLIAIILASDVLGTVNNILNVYTAAPVWIATISAIIFGVLAWNMLHLGDYFGERPDDKEAWQGWLMLSPNIIGFMIFFAGPLLLSFYLSFTNATVGAVPEVTWFKNYTDMLSLEFANAPDGVASSQVLTFGYTELARFGNFVIGAKDTLFWFSLRNTIIFCMMLVPLSVIPALILSIILNSKLPGMKFYRAVYFLPSVAAVVGTALIWRWLYDPTIGFFNYIITGFVTFLNNTLGLGLADPNIPWLTGPSVMLVSIVFLAAWQVVGFNTVLFLAGLQGIPRELYEAATVDGADGMKQFYYVTLPMLAPTTFFVVITTVITGLQVFNEPYALFPARPIPIEATTAVYYLYNQGFFRFNFGYASAIAWFMFAVIFLITLLQFRLSRSNAYEG